MTRRTFDTKQRAKARKLFDSGLSCNATAKKVGFAPSTISRWAREEGLSFDRSKTAKAVEAHRIDLAESRQLLAEKMMTAAHRMVDDIEKPYTVFNFGGKDNTFNEHTFESAPVEVRRNILTTAGIAFDKATRIVEHAPEADVSAEVRAALVGFSAGLHELFGPDDAYGQVTDAGGNDGAGRDGEPGT